MSESYKLSSGKTKFELPGGESFEINLVELIARTDAMRKDIQDGKCSPYDVLDMVVQMVNDDGKGPLLNSGQADEFLDMATVAYLDAKKKRLGST